MAACGSLRALFDNPLPESSSLIESLSSWNQTKIKPKKQIEAATLTEIFGELHFQEKTQLPANSPPPSMPSASDRSPRFDLSEFDGKKPSLDSLLGAAKDRYRDDPKSNGGFSSKNSESLQLCTEGLGSESSDDVEGLMNDYSNDWRSDVRKEKGDDTANGYTRSCSDVRPRSVRRFPPPISSIGRSGKPSVCFKSYREGGRFVLREIVIPTQEFLHASREDGRLKLHFVHPEVEISEEEEEEEQDEDDEQGQELKEEN